MRFLIFLLVAASLVGCSASKSSFSPDKKYSLQQVEKDYALYQEILKGSHPGLYWYNDHDHMEAVFSSRARSY